MSPQDKNKDDKNMEDLVNDLKKEISNMQCLGSSRPRDLVPHALRGWTF